MADIRKSYNPLFTGHSIGKATPIEGVTFPAIPPRSVRGRGITRGFDELPTPYGVGSMRRARRCF